MKFNPLEGKFVDDYCCPPSGGGGSVSIPELHYDPISPSVNDAWVLREGNLGEPIGLLLSILGTEATYKLSYKTISGSIVRTELT